MTSKEVLKDYFRSNLTTSLISYQEFEGLILKEDNSIGEETIKQWYMQLKLDDDRTYNKIEKDIGTSIEKIGRVDISEFKELQNKNYFTMEEFVDNLYNIGVNFDNELTYLNMRIEKSIKELQSLQDCFNQFSNERSAGVDMNNIYGNSSNLINTIKQLRENMEN